MINKNKSLAGLYFKGVGADGHCLFYAINEGIAADNSKSSLEAAKDLRAEVAKCLFENHNDYIGFLQDELEETGRSYEEYVTRIRDTSAWGGQVEIRAMTRILKRAIVVI